MIEILDAQVREDIINTTGSVVVSASAGSGKTTIMIKKILDTIQKINDHRKVAAITFTVKATEEIKRKAIDLGGNSEAIVMTNDSFIEFEIIRPFLKDAFGEEYRNDFIISYDKSTKFNSFEKGVETLKVNNILGTYWNIKRNFKFELAKKIMEYSQAAREYFKAKYVMLFLDEYQDSDTDMHNLFMYIKNVLNIDLFIVGDIKQAIYLWRGAQRNIFNLLESEGMAKFELITNFRSHPEIVNYANLIHNETQFNTSYSKNVEHVVHCRTEDFVQSFKDLCDLEVIDRKKSITVIANINNDAKNIAESLNNLGFNFAFIPRTPLDDGSENSHILKGLASYILDVNYSVYDLAEVLRIEQQRTILDSIEKLIKPVLENIPLKIGETIENSRIKFYKIISDFNDMLGLNINQKESGLLLNTLNNEYYHPAFIKSDDLYKVMTVFGSKGLEFNQVISFASYYNPADEGKNNNHYVCVTRAEDKFIMFEDVTSNYSEKISKLIEEKILESSYLYKMIDHT